MKIQNSTPDDRSGRRFLPIVSLCAFLAAWPGAVHAGGPSDPTAAAAASAQNADSETEQKGIQPALSVDAGMDYSSLGTLYSLVPQMGLESSHAALSFGIPFSATRFSTTGLGDVYLQGSLSTGLGPLSLEAGLTGGFPTGNSDLGLTVGKTTYDAYGSAGVKWGIARFSVDGGYTNGTGSNLLFLHTANAAGNNRSKRATTHHFGYQRPFVADGLASHYSGGFDFDVLPRLTLSLGGYAILPTGQQIVYSRLVRKSAPATTPPAAGSTTGRKPPIFKTVSTAIVDPSEVRDHGASLSGSISLSPAVSMTLGLTRSVPFHLTTFQFGLSFDVLRMMSHSGQG